MRVTTYIFAFFLLLIAPLIAHSLHHSTTAEISTHSLNQSERLVIITPHDEDIRDEFRWAFADWHQQQFGQAVALEFLSPGGTTDIKRQLDITYREIRGRHGGNLPPENEINTGIDLVWGGGDTFFDRELKPLGILRPIDLDAAALARIFPQPVLSGVKLYDQERDKGGNPSPPRWVGVCLSSFGIIYNPDLYAALNLPSPRTWNDLTDPQLAGGISLADPSHSGTAALIYAIILERAMADGEGVFLQQAAHRGIPMQALQGRDDYEKALDLGWKRGMAELLLIAANARVFSDDARQPPLDVSTGDAAAGTAIDFYGRVTQESVGPQRLQFIAPAGATVVTPDPIAILYGVHGRQLELANHFVEFLLSPQGQKLWILKPGQPGGPRQRALRRAPIRRDLYEDRTGWTDDINYFTQTSGFILRQEWLGTFTDLRMVWTAAWIDSREELRDAYAKILAVPDMALRGRLLDEIANLPVTRKEVQELMARRRAVEADPNQDADQWRARERISWSGRFREHYRQVAGQAR